jgi:hypothetical protein
MSAPRPGPGLDARLMRNPMGLTTADLDAILADHGPPRGTPVAGIAGSRCRGCGFLYGSRVTERDCPSVRLAFGMRRHLRSPLRLVDAGRDTTPAATRAGRKRRGTLRAVPGGQAPAESDPTLWEGCE